VAIFVWSGVIIASMSTLETVCEFFGLDTVPTSSPVTLVNRHRDELPLLFRRLNFEQGAEIGVEVGRYSKVLCEGHPGMRLHCVDAWQAYRGYREHVSQEKVDGFFEATKQRLGPYNVNYIRKFSVDAAKDFKKNSLDFVYIDANHALQYVIADIAAWEPIVKPGGILCGHDYAHRGGRGYNCHVIEAVQAWTTAYRIEPWFVIGSRERLPDGARPTAPSWLWVKNA
jgi:hypothetical protein